VKAATALVLVLLSARASAEPVRIRMATVAPEGSSWAHEFHTLAREIESATRGEVQIKWYLGGIAGDEVASLERVRRGQLDGVAGAMFCDRLAPSIRIGRVIGLFQSREEWQYVMNRLIPQLDKEFNRSGFVDLGLGSFGDIMFFSRHPIRTFDELKATRFWSYDLDEMTTSLMRMMGIDVVPMPLDAASHAYDEGKVDGFISTPTAALAFQWSARARYLSDLTAAELPGCIVMTERVMDMLTLEQRRIVIDATAKFAERFRELGRMQDDELLGGLFERQGLHRSLADASLRAGFLAASRAARDKLAPHLVPHALLARTLGWLADYRSEHADDGATSAPPPASKH